jgi:hypothetical protein
MRGVLGWLAALALLAPTGGEGAEAAREAREAAVERTAPERMRVTQGSLRPGADGRLRSEEPKMRAVVAGSTGPVTELRFTYLGPTAEQKALASGELRRQVGLKLRALDGCNVVYVMWRIAPKPGVVVSLKRNPGEHTSGECGNRGYSTVRPRSKTAVPELKPGEAHVLRAELDGRALRVRVDGASVWEGELPTEALGFDGPAGLRTDNARVEVELLTSPPAPEAR